MLLVAGKLVKMTDGLALEAIRTDAGERVADGTQKSDCEASNEIISLLSDEERERLAILQGLFGVQPRYIKKGKLSKLKPCCV